MKKIFAFLFVLAALPMMAADLELVVNASSPGYVDAKTIDVASVGADEEIIIELWLNNLDFELAGFEGEIQFPTWLVQIDTANPATAYNSPLTATQHLPADATGTQTATTFRNSEGYARIGGVVTDPDERESTGNQQLATLRLRLGRDYNSTGSAVSSCTSVEEVIKFLACSTGASNCHIIADDSASSVTVNYTAADLEIALIDSGTTIIKGDANASGTFTTQDVGSALQCIIFGDTETNANCPINDDDADEWLRRLDVNCSGAATPQDIGPLVRRAVGLNNRPSTKNLSFNAVDGEGSFELPGGDSAAYVVGVTLAAQGKVQFGTPELSKEGIEDGWQVISKNLPGTNSFKYILFHMGKGDLPVPSIHVPYKAAGQAQVAIADVDTVALAGNGRHMPSLNRMDLRDK